MVPGQSTPAIQEDQQSGRETDTVAGARTKVDLPTLRGTPWSGSSGRSRGPTPQMLLQRTHCLSKSVQTVMSVHCPPRVVPDTQRTTPLDTISCQDDIV